MINDLKMNDRYKKIIKNPPGDFKSFLKILNEAGIRYYKIALAGPIFLFAILLEKMRR